MRALLAILLVMACGPALGHDIYNGVREGMDPVLCAHSQVRVFECTKDWQR